jgi:3-oxosteroid 1-dehydrogenase
MKELVVKDGKVTGVIVEREGESVTIETTYRFILAMGGIARNDEMRKKYHAAPITADCTSASSNDIGDASQLR